MGSSHYFIPLSVEVMSGPIKPFRFRFERSLQAAAYLIKLAGGELPYIHLLKMLYIADREYLAEYGEMITGDRVCAMKHGPVLSCVLNLIRGRDSRSDEWSVFIRTVPRKHVVRLERDPGTGKLCRASEARLRSVFERYGNLKPFEVVRLTHELPEWEVFYRENTSTAIPWKEILRLQGKEEMIPVAMQSIDLHDHQVAMSGALHEAR